MSYALENFTKSAFSVFDMMLQMQRIGLEAMTMYEPLTAAYLDAVMASQSVGLAAMKSRRSINTPGSVEAPLVATREEVASVEAPMPQVKPIRVRRVVLEKPVQQDVTLQAEPLVEENSRPLALTSLDVPTEVAAEKLDLTEVPVAAEAVHPVEEALPPPESTESAEMVPDTADRDNHGIDQPAQEPAVLDASKTEDEKPPTDDHQPVAPVEPETKSGDQEWH
ncbi:MAG: hypothetical protein ABSC06_23120 [Rhodopila sp.]|jgi:hypothetical protein